MVKESYHKIFISYLAALSLIWSAGVWFLFKKAEQFGCGTLIHCLVYPSTPDNILEVHNDKIAATPVKNDEKKNKKQDQNKNQMLVVPESGTLLLYDQSTQFAVTLLNESSAQLKIDFYLADQLVKSIDLENTEKKVLIFKIHPFENRLSWKINENNKEIGEGFFDVLKMDSSLLKEAISTKRKVMVLE